MFFFGNDFTNLLKLSSTCIDNNVFKLHYKATFIILLTCSLLVTSHQYIGDPIDCITHAVPQNVMDTYCWIHSTFSVDYNKFSVEEEEDHYTPHPGVGPVDEENATVRHHKYYQWVCFVLFFQALFFYLPHQLWKRWEGGTMKLLVRDLDVPIVDLDTKSQKINLVVEYFILHQNRHGHYVAKFFLCEILNLANVICQIFFIDVFLGGEFSSYGTDVLAMTEMHPEDRPDPMARVFPKVTKCTFRRFGPTGTMEKFDGLCVLPLNIINEKIYVFLWFWLILLAVVTSANVLYRLSALLLPWLRKVLLHGRAGRLVVHAFQVQSLSMDRGDWFLLYQMSKNMDQLVFKEFIEILHRTIEEKDEDDEVKRIMIA